VEAGNGLRDGAWLVLLRPARHGITEGIRERKSEAAAAEGGDGAGGAIGWTKADMAGAKAKAATGAKLQVDLRLEGLFLKKRTDKRWATRVGRSHEPTRRGGTRNTLPTIDDELCFGTLPVIKDFV
jgi:hypothetical protein